MDVESWRGENVGPRRTTIWLVVVDGLPYVRSIFGDARPLVRGPATRTTRRGPRGRARVPIRAELVDPVEPASSRPFRRRSRRKYDGRSGPRRRAHADGDRRHPAAAAGDDTAPWTAASGSPCVHIVAFVAICVALLIAGPLSRPAAGLPPVVAAAASNAYVRVDQLGYVAEREEGRLAAAPTDRRRRRVPRRESRRRNGRSAARLTPAAARWNQTFGAVNPLVFTDLRTAGRYRVEVPSLGVQSPWFTIGSSAARCSRHASADAVQLLPGPARRRGRDRGSARTASRHTSTTRDAALYAWPTYESPDSDVIVGASLDRLPAASTSRVAGSTPATSSSSRTRRRTPWC